MTSRKHHENVGRNDPCPCGSGKKWKKCHGGPDVAKAQPPASEDAPDSFAAQINAMQAKQLQRERQQGLGRPIISEMFQGHRFVDVGNVIMHSRNWRTFHDFLFEYLPRVIGKDWGAAELAKPIAERHPLLRLHEAVKELRREYGGQKKAIQSAPMTGAAAAYLGLAYNLYLLAHNAKIHELLLKRLRITEQFWPALYETSVAAAFIKAGFTLALEDEGDSTTSHCEFVATNRHTGKSFAVEAKSRQRNKRNADVTNQLHSALKKAAAHTRIVFIDVNLDARGKNTKDPAVALPWLKEALDSLRLKEATLTIDGVLAPEAYVVLTSQPYEGFLNEPYAGLAFAGEGFKIPDFKIDSGFSSVREARLAHERHRELHDLMESMRTHQEIPKTFDGEIPEFAFAESAIPRLLIGRTYGVPGPDGGTVPGILQTATVLEAKLEVAGVYRLEDGRQVIVTCPLTPEELAAYRRHPDTFFGTYLRQGRVAETPLDLYEFFLESYGKTPKDGLLNLMEDHRDIEALRPLSQEELAKTYCERMAESAARLPRKPSDLERQEREAT